jgi:glyoxylase-like metal-dependent hydrolase (beta-lactamase superfamily II)
VKLAPSVHRIGNGMVNAYLVEEAGAVTVIDAGLPGLWRDLLGELDAMGRSLEDVRALLLTHGHSDHIGFAERLRRSGGVAVRVHELDVALARRQAPSPSKGMPPFHWRPILGFLLYALRNGYGVGPKLGQVIAFGDGAVLDVPGALRVIHLPGHTPGSAALLAPDHGALFVGDALVTRSVATGRLGPQIGPFTADRAVARESLRNLDGIEAALALPGHGAPWTGGVAKAVELARAGESAPAPATGLHAPDD